jgi:hypothetical protein
MRSEVITVGPLESGHLRLAAPEQEFQFFTVGKTVGAVREYDDTLPVQLEQAVKCVDRGLAGTEGCKRLLGSISELGILTFG